VRPPGQTQREANVLQRLHIYYYYYYYQCVFSDHSAFQRGDSINALPTGFFAESEERESERERERERKRESSRRRNGCNNPPTDGRASSPRLHLAGIPLALKGREHNETPTAPNETRETCWVVMKQKHRNIKVLKWFFKRLCGCKKNHHLLENHLETVPWRTSFWRFFETPL